LNNSNESEHDWITDDEGTRMVATLEDCWQGYHTKHSEIPSILPSDETLYFLNHEDDEKGGGSNNDGDETLYYCGGFGGGPGQMAHAATTYAAVLALCVLATSGNSTPEGGSDENTGSDVMNEPDDEYASLHYSDRAKRVLSEIRIPLYRWMVSLQVPDTGGYRMQHDGEVDVRATYTIACCSKLLGLLEHQPATTTTTSQSTGGGFTVLGRPLVINFVQSCQTYEGGMGGEPFSEAHGGYTFCAVAALKLLGALNNKNTNTANSIGSNTNFDVGALLGWLGRRQLSYEGGFSGRSNKLVDGCYSFWQGGAVAIASSCSDCLAGDDSDTSSDGDDSDSDEDPWLARYRKRQQQSSRDESPSAPSAPPTSESTATTHNLSFPLLYDVFLLERYILLCAQEVTGGLRDKPSKPRDFYHTCYNLSGLSIAQHCSLQQQLPVESDNNSGDEEAEPGFGDSQQTLVGHTHPCYNIRIDRVAKILEVDWGE
jgi:protein farnesyltransferase subunit beta